MTNRFRTLCLVLMVLSFLLLGIEGDASQPDGPLDWTLGSWHGVRRDAQDGTEAPMRVLVERTPDGLGQIERLEVQTDADPYVGFAVCTRDPVAGRWMRIYANDVHPKFARLAAQSVVGERVIWQSVTSRPPRGSRLVSERLGPDRWRRTQEFSTDNGVTWQIRFIDELSRDQPMLP